MEMLFIAIVFGLQHKKKLFKFWDFFFLKKYEKKAHNIYFLMLDPKFKTFCLVSSLIGHE
jgi:hypothetical protein